MKLKSLATTVLVLAVLAAGVWFLNREKVEPPSDPRIGKPLVERAVLEKIAAIRIRASEAEVNLATTGDAADPRWVVREFHNLPVDFERLSRLVTEIREAKFTRFASAQPERVARMEFTGTKVELRDKDGAELWSAEVGGRVQSGGSYIKIGTETAAYVTSYEGYLDATARGWTESRLVPAKPESVVGLEISFPSGDALKFKREKIGSPWTTEGLPEGETLKQAEIDSLLSRLVEIRFAETADPITEPALSARDGARKVALELLDGRTLSITMARRAPDAAAPTPEPAPDGSTAPTPPAPPVEIFVRSSVTADAINTSMAGRGFQIADWTFTALPADRSVLIQPAPPAPPPAAP